jgi:hypothetical protein
MLAAPSQKPLLELLLPQQLNFSLVDPTASGPHS